MKNFQRAIINMIGGFVNGLAAGCATGNVSTGFIVGWLAAVFFELSDKKP